MPRFRSPRFKHGDSVENWILAFIRELESHDQIHMHREFDLTKALQLSDGEGRQFFLQQIKPNVKLIELSGASVTIPSMIIPSVVWGCFTYVNTAITGATGFHIGTPADTDAWANNAPVTVKSRTNFGHYTDLTVRISPTNQDVVITAVGPNFSGGILEVTHYYSDFVN